jgi:hypothetical protein
MPVTPRLTECSRRSAKEHEALVVQGAEAEPLGQRVDFLFGIYKHSETCLILTRMQPGNSCQMYGVSIQQEFSKGG